MHKILSVTFVIVTIFGILGFILVQKAQARGRYGSFRVGGYTSHGKGSHYVGGYIRNGPALRQSHRIKHR